MRYSKLIPAGLILLIGMTACSNPLSSRFPQPGGEEEREPEDENKTSLVESAPSLPLIHFG